MRYIKENEPLKSFIIILLLSLATISFSQEMKLVFKDSILGKYSHFSVDNFGRVYLCRNDVILQFSNQYDTLFSTSLKQLTPSSLESSKSFRTLVFDQERSVVHFLDNTLTDIHGQIDLVSLDLQQPILVCESFAGNTFWVLDAGSMRLVKLNENLEKVIQTENLVTLFDADDLPNQMLESNDFLFVSIPGKGVGVFDVFGTYIRFIEMDCERIDVLNNYLLVKAENIVQAIPTETFFVTDVRYELPSDVIDFRFANSKVYVLREKGLFIGEYEIKE